MAGQSARLRIAVNGYGVIGKRVADAVTCQLRIAIAPIDGDCEAPSQP